MTEISAVLSQLGLTSWFLSHLDESKASRHRLARVISVHKNGFDISDGNCHAFAECSGNLMHSADSSLDMPTVGDWVYADIYDEQNEDSAYGIIHGVLPRKSLLKRKAAGKQIDFQLIAANIDFAFIVQAVDDNFNLRRLERYLLMVNDVGITPIILLSKSDLKSSTEVEAMVESVTSIAPAAKVLAYSTMENELPDQNAGLKAIKDYLVAGKTYCLLGSSGVGKTTLLNSLLGQDQYRTQTVSKVQSKGRHTTTHRELIRLQNDAMLIDTPGMRELGTMSEDSSVDETFAEVSDLVQQCKFNNCSHTNEKGCAVLAAIDSGELSEQRFLSFIKMKKEVAFNEMSYVEKRKRDKDFGKMIKNVMKDKKR